MRDLVAFELLEVNWLHRRVIDARSSRLHDVLNEPCGKNVATDFSLLPHAVFFDRLFDIRFDLLGARTVLATDPVVNLKLVINGLRRQHLNEVRERPTRFITQVRIDLLKRFFGRQFTARE